MPVSYRIVALLGGGNWADASVSHILVPSDVNLTEAADRYNREVRESYFEKIRTWKTCEVRRLRGIIDPSCEGVVAPKWVSFSEFLVENCGAGSPINEEVEVFWEP
jgi:hypothetical protein